MKKSEKIVVKKDMLSLLSTVQEILRALYFYGADYILVQSGKRERLLHKEQLVALLEQGREKATLEDVFTLNLNESIYAKMQMEDIPSMSLLLQFIQTGAGADGELSLSTFEEHRERKVIENTVIMPDWWGIPLPLVHIDDDRVFLNAVATEAIPGGAVSMARQIDRMRTDRIVIIKEKKKERTFSLTPLAENTYLVEDISGDFEMAEDLVWWAAIGRAFMSRMQENGLIVKRLSPFEDAPENVAEIIPCHWENELVGRLAIRLPELAEMKTEEKTEAQPKEEVIPKAVPVEEPVTEKKTLAPKKKTKVSERKPIKKKTETFEASDEPAADTNLRKSAAKNAYGMKGSRPVAKPQKTADNEERGGSGERD